MTQQYPRVEHTGSRWVWHGDYDDKGIPSAAKWRWNPQYKAWWTQDYDKAILLREYFDASAQKAADKAKAEYKPEAPPHVSAEPFPNQAGWRWVWHGGRDTKHIPDGAQWKWAQIKSGHWATVRIWDALKLDEYFDQTAHDAVKMYHQNIKDSRAEAPLSDIPIPCPEGIEFYPFQKAGIQYAANSPSRIIMIGDEMGLGKAQGNHTLTPTPDGWKQIGKIQVGDFVIGSDGQSTRVRGVFPQGIRSLFRVRFSDDSSVEADGEHLWTVSYRAGGKRWTTITLTTEQLRTRPTIEMKWVVGTRKTTQLDLSKVALYLPMLKAPVEFSKKDLPVPPYALGQLIANGGLTNGALLTTNSKDWPEVKRNLIAEGVQIGAEGDKGSCIAVTLLNQIRKVRDLGLCVKSREKFIPVEYLHAAVDDRIVLLRGLMDGDGSITKTRCRVTYHTLSKQLADDAIELVESLGGIASRKGYERLDHHGEEYTEYQVRVRLSFNPFSVRRKAGRYRPGSHASPTRTVKYVEYTRNAECTCIAVEAKDNLYCTEHYILTHNTPQAIGVGNLTHAKKVCVVCPASLRMNWEREFKRFSTVDHEYYIHRESKPFPELATCVITNYERLRKTKKNQPVLDQYLNTNWDLIIFDEAHRLKGDRALIKAQFKKGCLRVKQGNVKDVAGNWKFKIQDAGLIYKAPKVLLLTGTPIVNRPSELFNLLSTISFQRWGDWRWFMQRYANAYEESIGYGRTAWNTSGHSNEKELQDDLRAYCMVRRLKEQVLTELPEKRRQVVLLDPREAGALNLVKKESKLVPQVEGMDFFEDLRKLRGQTVKFEEASKIRHEIGLKKVKPVVEYLDDVIGQGECKILLFCHHKDVVAKYVGELGEERVVWITGDVPIPKRQALVDQFQTDDKIQVAILSLDAASEGLTLTAACLVIMAELGWTPSRMKQAEDRAHRIGQTSEVLVQYLVFAGSLEAHIASLLGSKETTAHAILDDTEAEAPSMEAAGRHVVQEPVEPVIPDATVFEERAKRKVRKAKEKAEKKAKEIGEELPELTDKIRQAIRNGLIPVAENCDGAREEDGEGFNKPDTKFGKWGAAQGKNLTDQHYYLYWAMLRKYWRQIDPESYGVMFPKSKRATPKPKATKAPSTKREPTPKVTKKPKAAVLTKQKVDANMVYEVLVTTLKAADPELYRYVQKLGKTTVVGMIAKGLEAL